jgi:three-Cys-motif partner protein
MPGKDHHEKPYDEGTMDKLGLYQGYVREWLPVFVNKPELSSEINIFDFFAGPGMDLDGKPGSPNLAYQEIVNAINAKKVDNPPPINLYLNEYAPEKHKLLSNAVNDFTPIKGVTVKHSNLDFDQVFKQWYPLMTKKQAANLIFLDQNGVKYVTPTIFNKILSLDKTDLLFFISSAIVNRFKEDPSIISRVPVNEDDLKKMNSTNVHRIVADAYRRTVPTSMRYFLAHFSIKKDSNVYGLIFGSHHPLGMDKFLRKCWEMDRVRGEANFDIDGEAIDISAPSLFSELDKPNKLTIFEKELAEAILTEKTVKTNKDIFIFALQRGFLGSHAKKVVGDLIAENRLPQQTLPISYIAWNNKEENKAIVFNEGILL